ncbi:MAG: CaiB/BaiF CoA transferase family protein [Acidimicrobiales bacterium]
MTEGEHDIGDEGPLASVKVVELSMYVQGPVAGLTLASLGADVVKIEQVGRADAMRTFQAAFGVTFDERGQAWIYSSLNRNKRALALDIASAAGTAVFLRLIAGADVFVTNLREQGLRRHGADPDALFAVNPRLVYCRGAGFATRGPLADDPCQDTVGMAYAGFMDTTSQSDAPNYPPGSMSDILTGTNMAAAAMAGLLKRASTGRGCVVGTSQTQALLWLQSQGLGSVANLGTRMERFSHEHGANPIFGVYRTSDGWIAVAALLAPQWPVLATALGVADLLADARFATFDDVLRNRDELRPLVAERLGRQTTAHWWEVLRRAGVWVAPVHRVEELASDEHILANEYLVTFDDGFVGPPGPFDVDGWPGARGAAAEYGEHTDEILAELGYDDEQVLQFRTEGAIW